MKKLYEKYEGIVDTFIILFSTLFVGGYYYGIQQGFVPYYDQAANIIKYNMIFQQGEKFSFYNILWTITSFFSYLVKGLSYDNIRLQNAILYALIFGLTLILVYIFMSNKKNFFGRWYFLPFIIYMMALLNDGLSEYFGKQDFGITIYPFDNHQLPIIMALLVFIFISLRDRCTGKKKRLINVLLILSFLYGLVRSDSIFIVICAFPLVLLWCYDLILRKKRDVSWTKICLALLTLLVVIRFVAGVTGVLPWLFVESQTQYGGMIYGISNWGSINDLLPRIYNFLNGLLGNYNCLSAGKAIININSFSYIIRTGILLLSIWALVKTIKGDLLKQNGSYTVRSICLAVLLLSIAFLCADFGGHSSNVRYLTTLLPFMIFTFIVYVDKTLSKMEWNSLYKFLFCAFSILILIFIKPVYMNSTDNIYDENLDEVSKFIKDNNLGNGLASYFYAYNLTIKMDNECYVDPVDYRGNFIEWPKANSALRPQVDEYNYFVYFNEKGNLGMSDTSFSKGAIVKVWGKADEIYELGRYTIYYYEDGIDYSNFYEYSPKELKFSGAKIINKKIVLNKDDLQYGPYCDLDIGSYEIKIKGENIQNLQTMITSDSGKNIVEQYNIASTENSITYNFKLKKDTEDIEFSSINKTDTQISIESITLKKVDSFKIDYKFQAKDMRYSEKQKVSGQNYAIGSGEVQYGPYISLQSGEYQVTIKGDNLDKNTIRLSSDSGDVSIPIEFMNVLEKEIVYRFVLEEDAEDIELIMNNDTDHIVYLESYQIEEVEGG